MFVLAIARYPIRVLIWRQAVYIPNVSAGQAVESPSWTRARSDHDERGDRNGTWTIALSGAAAAPFLHSAWEP
jgi:hypothetical protein